MEVPENARKRENKRKRKRKRENVHLISKNTASPKNDGTYTLYSL